jgi:AcrR family transcriptional regulator
MLVSLLAAELRDHLPSIAKRLIRRATDRLPEPQRARYREKWLAHLDDLPGGLSKLRHGLGCYFAARKVVPNCEGLLNRARRTIRSFFISARNAARAGQPRTFGFPGSTVAVVLVLLVGSPAMLPIARAPIASAPIRPVALPHDVVARPNTPIGLPSPFAESTSGGDLSIFNSDVLKATDDLSVYGPPATSLITPAGLSVLQANPALTNAIYASPSLNVSSLIGSDVLKASEGLSIYGSPAAALITSAGLDVLQANPALTNAIYASPSLNVSSLIGSDVLKASEGLSIYGSPATALITPAGLDVLQANPALTNAIYASPSLNVSSLINSDVLKASEGLPGSGLSTVALNAPPGLDVLQANPALTNAIYAAPAPNVSSLIGSDVLKASEGLSIYGSPATSLIEPAALNTSFAGGSANGILPSSSIGAVLLPAGDVLKADGDLPQSILPTTSLDNFSGSNSLRYGGRTEFPLPPLATPLQPLAPECALCSCVKI